MVKLMITDRIEHGTKISYSYGVQGQRPSDVCNSAAYESTVRTLDFEAHLVDVPVYRSESDNIPLRHEWAWGDETLEATLVRFMDEWGLAVATYHVGLA